MSSNNEARDKRINELSKQIAEHKATVARIAWRNFGRVYKSYVTSANELNALIVAPNAIPQLAIDISSVDQHHGKRDLYFDELTRRLHNYLSSCSTLINNSIAFMKQYQRADVGSEYSHRVSRIDCMEESKFLQDLRNNFTHKRLPPLSLSARYAQGDPKISLSVTLNSERLLKDLRWSNSQAKSYIRSREEVVLHECAESFNDEMRKLYDWLFVQFRIVNAADIEDVERLQAELSSLYGE